MTGAIEVNPELVRVAALKTAQVRDRISTALNTLESTIDGLGSPWGEDRYGHEFAHGSDGGYVAARQKLAKLTDDLAKTGGNHSDAQIQAGKSLDTLQQVNASSFRTG